MCGVIRSCLVTFQAAVNGCHMNVSGSLSVGHMLATLYAYANIPIIQDVAELVSDYIRPEYTVGAILQE